MERMGEERESIDEFQKSLALVKEERIGTKGQVRNR